MVSEPTDFQGGTLRQRIVLKLWQKACLSFKALEIILDQFPENQRLVDNRSSWFLTHYPTLCERSFCEPPSLMGRNDGRESLAGLFCASPFPNGHREAYANVETAGRKVVRRAGDGSPFEQQLGRGHRIELQILTGRAPR